MRRARYLAALALLAGCGDAADDRTGSVAVNDARPERGSTPLPDPAPAVSPAPVPSPSPALLIPAAFHGTWARTPDQCVPGSELRIAVHPDSILFFESLGRPQAVEIVSPDEVRLTLAFTGEGEQWSQENTLTLLDGGRRLRRQQDTAESVTYDRCETR